MFVSEALQLLLSLVAASPGSALPALREVRTSSVSDSQCRVADSRSSEC